VPDRDFHAAGILETSTGAHDPEIHLHRPLASKNTRSHGDALFGNYVRQKSVLSSFGHL
jgi:hypothetical protein